MPQDDEPASSTAASRLEQINGQLAPKSRRKRKPDALPADWSDVMGQVHELRRISSTAPTESPGYQRHKQNGKLWVWERIEALLDKDSFKAVGSVSGTAQWRTNNLGRDELDSFIPSNNVSGFGKINNRPILITADDFSLRAGHADGASAGKTLYIEQLCVELGIPMIKLVDGASGGGSVTTIVKAGFSYVPPLPVFAEIGKQLDMGIPNIGAVLGSAVGLGAARAVSCHFSVMAADIGALFNAGPAVVAKATFEEGLSHSELGGPEIHCTNGTIDNMAKDEKGAFQQIKTVLGYLPNCGRNEAPPITACDDPVDRNVESLRSIVPRRRQRSYSVRSIIETTVDQGSFFEIGSMWGLTCVIGLARMNGRPVGITASNPDVGAGALDALGAQKMIKHLNFCDVFNLPILQFVDCPGYAIGTVAERSATMKWGVELGKTLHATTTPLFSIIIRKCYGIAGALLVDCRYPHQRVAWPSGEWGSLPLEGGVEASHARELKVLPEEARAKRYDELFNNYSRLLNPVRTATMFDIEEIIDPSETRAMLCAWAEYQYKVKLPERVRERQNGKINPVFR